MTSGKIASERTTLIQLNKGIYLSNTGNSLIGPPTGHGNLANSRSGCINRVGSKFYDWYILSDVLTDIPQLHFYRTVLFQVSIQNADAILKNWN